MSRRARTYLIRGFYVAITAFIVASVAFPAIQSHRVIHTSEYAQLARRLFHTFTWLQMFFLPLASAIAASDMLHSEARLGTLSILLLTPLKPSGIVWGKWKAVMVHTATLAFCGLPVLAVAVYLGGVGIEDLAWSLTLSLALSGVAAAMSICYSVRDRTVVEAALRAFLMLQFSVIPYGFLTGILSIGRSMLGVHLCAWIHPYIAWWAAANPAEVGEPANHGWIGATVVSGLFIKYYLTTAIPPLLITREGSQFLEGPARGGPARNRESHEPAQPGPIWESWPLLWKECATRTIRLPGAARGTLLVLFCILTLVAILTRPEGAVVQLSLLGTVTTAMLVAVGAGHFAREKENRGFEMLLSTPISAAHVVGTKLLSGVLCLEVGAPLLLMVVGYLTLITGRTSAAIGLSMLLFMTFSYVLASSLSLRSNTYRTAFVGTAGVLIFILIGIPIMTGLMDTTPLSGDPYFLFVVHAVHPLTVVLSERKFGYDELLLFAHLLLYGTLTAALVVDMIFRFRRLAEQR